MSYSLNTTILNPLSGKEPKNAVILCHGYGGDGKDISILAGYWKHHMPDTVFICPDAPEKCAVSPTGFQWFDLMNQTADQILTKSFIAEMPDEEKTKVDVAKLKGAIFGNIKQVRTHMLTNAEKAIDKIFTDFDGYLSPTAGFFLWLDVGSGEKTALKLWQSCGVRVLPGRYLSKDFDGQSPGDRYIRVAMVAEPEETKNGLIKIREFLR